MLQAVVHYRRTKLTTVAFLPHLIGQTEWSRNGRYTGTTDLPLLPAGEDKILQTASAVFGTHKLIDPKRLLKVYCSPRQRAQRTLELLLESASRSSITNGDRTDAIDIETTEDVREWTYADYEGLKTHEIIQLRKERGHDDSKLHGGKWDLWQTGSEGPGSETPDQVAARVDNLIAEIVHVHGEYLDDVNSKTGDISKWGGRRDVLVVAHGHILRAFVKRWIGSDMGSPINLMLEPGGVCGLSYAHGNVDERAVLVGMSFPSSPSGE